MEDSSWYREPVGDYVASFQEECFGSTNLRGHSLALEKWHATTLLLSEGDACVSFKRGLSRSQMISVAILREWWSGQSQDESLSLAARNALEQTASDTNAENDHLDIDRDLARLNESRYHKDMFLLFQLEFVQETRLLHLGEFRTFVGFVQGYRERCAQSAALQRVAYSFVRNSMRNVNESFVTLDQSSPNADACKRIDLNQTVIPACIESCPWLQRRVDPENLPFYLWDTEKRETVETQSLAGEPQFTCVSHTWGRWRLEEEPELRIPGVPWPVPQNSKFDIKSLPDQLNAAFGSGFIWFDLFCIPQDRSERALLEISRQAAIFGAARNVVVWFNDTVGWEGLRNVAKWLSFVYLRTSTNLKDNPYSTAELEFIGNEFPEDDIELYMWDSEASQVDVENEIREGLAAPAPWFTSLWTLQEASLRPDMILCDRRWEPLRAGLDIIIPLDHVIALSNYVARGTYRKGPPKEDLSRDTGGIVDLATAYRAELAKADVSTVVDELEEIPGSMDLTTLLVDTCMSDLNWISPGAVFTFGQLRQCTGSRAEAIMSVVGATDWYREYLARHKDAPPAKDLVLGYYQVEFLNEAMSRIGPTFFTAIPTDLRYLTGGVRITGDAWVHCEGHEPIGSMLPFTSSPTYLLPPQKYSFNAYNHPSIASWTIQIDGSVHVTRAGIVEPEDLTDEDLGEQDMIIAPLPDHARPLCLETEIETIDGDLKEWLVSFSNPSENLNVAVSLYQQIYLSKNIPGPHVGLLLRKVGMIERQTVFVKIGQFYTKRALSAEIMSREVDWLVI